MTDIKPLVKKRSELNLYMLKLVVTVAVIILGI